MFSDDLGTTDRLLGLAGGVLLLFVGVAMLSSRLVRPIAALVGLPARRIGGAAGKLASGNTVRNPGRTAATAAALMIGIALVAFIATLANGLKTSNREAIEEQVSADYVVTAQDGYTPYPAAIGDAVAASPAPEVVTPVRTGAALVNGDEAELGGIDPETITSTYTFDWTEGSDEVLADLGTTGAIVSANYADDHGMEIGTRLRLTSTDNRTADARIVGLYEPHPFYPLLESVTVSTELFDQLYDRPQNRWTWANVAGEPSDAGKAQLEEAVAGFPDAQVETREEWIQREDDDISEFLTFLYVLLALAVLISIFGMINTLVLSVYERTREIGMLRAIGMTRRQTRRMVRQESIITALIGAAIGLPLGIFLAALVTRALGRLQPDLLHPVVPAGLPHGARDRGRHPGRDHARAPRREARPAPGDRLRMTRFAIRGLLSRKLRTALTALAIVLGVAMISGTYVLTDSIDQAFDRIFTDIRKGSNAVISGKSAFDLSRGQRRDGADVRRVAARRSARASRGRGGRGKRRLGHDAADRRRRQGGRVRRRPEPRLLDRGPRLALQPAHAGRRRVARAGRGRHRQGDGRQGGLRGRRRRSGSRPRARFSASRSPGSCSSAPACRSAGRRSPASTFRPLSA